MNTDPLEEMVCYFFAQVLELEAVGRDDDFFELGGYSLLIFQLMGHLEEVFGTELPLRIVFEAPTPALFTERLREELQDQHADLGGILSSWERIRAAS